jgi:hypothetical protein
LEEEDERSNSEDEDDMEDDLKDEDGLGAMRTRMLEMVLTTHWWMS